MAIDSSLKLRIYNMALRDLGSRPLLELTENRESRRTLDSAWASDYLVKYCLEQGYWNFATRTVHATYDPSTEPDFGFQYAYNHPDDFVRVIEISAFETFNDPLVDHEYRDEAGYWHTDHQELYIRYISNGDDYGLNGDLWPETFIRFVAAQLAWECSEALTKDEAVIRKIASILKTYKTDARSKDAMNEGVKFPPVSSWVRARRGASSSGREGRGNGGWR
jgi:hypothetical protein